MDGVLGITHADFRGRATFDEGGISPRICLDAREECKASTSLENVSISCGIEHSSIHRDREGSGGPDGKEPTVQMPGEEDSYEDDFFCEEIPSSENSSQPTSRMQRRTGNVPVTGIGRRELEKAESFAEEGDSQFDYVNPSALAFPEDCEITGTRKGVIHSDSDVGDNWWEATFSGESFDPAGEGMDRCYVLD
ncbi:unnamed protein product [Choristocarpus tenellus]